MWGRHVENSIQMAVRKAKNDSQAQTRAQGVIRKLMTEPEPEVQEGEAPATPAKGKFADPAARFGKK
jgi:hypothetical protein